MFEIISFLKDWIIPLGATGMSIWFAASAKKDSERAQEVLKEIKEEIQGSQRKMIESAIGILDSIPQVIDGKIELAKLGVIQEASKTIRENAMNPNKLPQAEHDRSMIALAAHISTLLEKRV